MNWSSLAKDYFGKLGRKSGVLRYLAQHNSEMRSSKCLLVAQAV
jgi:hypothetical protein